MPRSYSRTKRVADLIQVALAEILQQEMKDDFPTLVTITSVEVSPDFSHAKIFVSVLDEMKVKETLTILNDAKKSLRYALAHAIKLRTTPELKFIYDDSAVRGSHIDELISKALKK